MRTRDGGLTVLRTLLAVFLLTILALGFDCISSTVPDTGTPPSTESPRITLHTNKGDIVIELFVQQGDAAGLFKQYLDEGYFDDAVFSEIHKGQWLLGGGYTAGLTQKESKPLLDESDNGLSNFRGRVSLYVPEAATSGTCQFMINLGTNSDVADYTVIGRVVEGMDIVDVIADLATTSQTARNGTSLPLLPLTPVSVNNPDLFIKDYCDQGTIPSGTNHNPVADAGTGGKVAPALTVTLDGSASKDPDNEILSYRWKQTAGTTVTLSNDASSRPTFTAPDGSGTLTFELSVQDCRGGTHSDTVSIEVISEPKVRLVTTKGDIVLEILLADAPVTSRNFLQYVIDKFYNGTIFHRVIKDFVVQGGAFLPSLMQKTGVRDPIVNEFSSTRSNIRATVAMAKLDGDPDSATCQFFINLTDNSANLDTQNGGFTVFARVIEGLTVVDAIGGVEVTTKKASTGQEFADIPTEDVVVNSAKIE